MSDTKSGDDKTLSVNTKKTLTLKRPGMEQGTVRQNFSHGRTKAVVVETKKRKFSLPGDRPEPAVVQPLKPKPAVTVAPPGSNRNPVAVADALTIEAEIDGTVDVLANDSDPDDDTLTVESFTQPAHGTVDCADGGECTYTSDLGFDGFDSFTYSVSDGELSAQAAVAVRVTPGASGTTTTSTTTTSTTTTSTTSTTSTTTTTTVPDTTSSTTTTTVPETTSSTTTTTTVPDTTSSTTTTTTVPSGGGSTTSTTTTVPSGGGSSTTTTTVPQGGGGQPAPCHRQRSYPGRLMWRGIAHRLQLPGSMRIVIPEDRPRHQVTLPDGAILNLSPILKTDREFFEKGLEELSPESRFAR